MAQPLQTINLVAPGFKGVNTEDSPLSLEANYAARADNCVIDNYGRIAARKGYKVITETVTGLGAEALDQLGIYRDELGNREMFSFGNNKIFKGEETLTDVTPGSYTVSGNNWDVVNFNNNLYMFQRGHEPLVYNDTLGAVTKMSSVTGAAGTPPEGNAVIAAWGRLWVADFEGDKSTVYWSDLLQGHVWTGGSTGSVDISTVWPDGYDEIRAMAAYNNQLIIFGKHSMVVYQGANSPATMELLDTVSGIGLRCRCGIVDIGTDVVFLSYDGLRSFGRTIQEKSMPINDLSLNIKQDLLTALGEETLPVRMEYSPENSFILLLFRSQSLGYCFDIRQTLENGSFRVTRWPGSKLRSVLRDTDGVLYLGTTEGLCKYGGYLDGTDGYPMIYYSPNLSFGDPSRLKILKKMKPTVIGGSGSVIRFRWGYDFEGTFNTQVVGLESSGSAEYNKSEYNEAEYSSGVLVRTFNINTSGNGASVVVGMEADIEGLPLSLQEFNIWSLLGRII